VAIFIEVMGLAPDPWNTNRKIVDEIARKLQIKKILGMKLPDCG